MAAPAKRGKRGVPRRLRQAARNITLDGWPRPANSELIFIAAEDALKLGLHDWMQIKLPDRMESPPLPPRRIDPLGVASFATRLFQLWDAIETNRGRKQFFSKAPKDAEQTWR